jgi:hypothetical protein
MAEENFQELDMDQNRSTLVYMEVLTNSRFCRRCALSILVFWLGGQTSSLTDCFYCWKISLLVISIRLLTSPKQMSSKLCADTHHHCTNEL